MSKALVDNISRPGQLTLRKLNRRSGEAMSAMQAGRFLPALIGALMLVAFAMAYVWTNHRAVQVGYEISALHQEQTRLTEMNRKFRAELANLTSLERLETVAKTQLGLVQPSKDQVREIK